MKRLLYLLVFVPLLFLFSCSGDIECETISVDGKTYSYSKGDYKVYEYASKDGYCIYTNAKPTYTEYEYDSYTGRQTNVTKNAFIRMYPNSLDLSNYTDYYYIKFVGYVLGENVVYYNESSKSIKIQTIFSASQSVTYEPIGRHDSNVRPSIPSSSTSTYVTPSTSRNYYASSTSGGYYYPSTYIRSSSTTEPSNNSDAIDRIKYNYYLIESYGNQYVSIYDDKVDSSTRRTTYINVGDSSTVIYIKKK